MLLYFCSILVHLFDNLQATASAADPSSIRRIDAWIQSALVSSVSSAGQIFARPVVVRQLDSVINRMQQCHNEELETFARFQAGFLSSKDFHRFLLIIIDFHGFL